MKILFVFLVFYLCPSSRAERQADLFEFGQDIGENIFVTSGSISLFEKIKRVSIVIPSCADLKYVRVDINNRLAPPTVKFDWDTRTVIMEYRPLQYSVSQYTVSAKGLWYCSHDSNSGVQKQKLEYIDFVI